MVAAAEPGQVDPVNPGEGAFAGVDREGREPNRELGGAVSRNLPVNSR